MNRLKLAMGRFERRCPGSGPRGYRSPPPGGHSINVAFRSISGNS